MSRRKRMLAELEDSFNNGGTDLGFRVTRSKREFNPHSMRGADIIVSGVHSEILLKEGSQRSDSAWDEGIVDDFEELTENMACPSISCPAASSAIFNPLTKLLEPIPVACPSSHTLYVPDMELSVKQRKKLKGRVKARSKCVAEHGEAQVVAGSSLKGVALRKRDAMVSAAISAEILQPQTFNGWTGRRGCVGYPHILSLPDALRMGGLKLINWDGGVSRLVKADDGTHWAALLGHPADKTSWAENTHAVDVLMLGAHKGLRFPGNRPTAHRRGIYDSIAYGYSHGQGQVYPMNFACSDHNRRIIEGILQSQAMQRVAHFMDHGLQSYFDKIHRMLTNLTTILLGIGHLGLKQSFDGCCFAACQFNFTNVATFPHEDFMNGFFLCCGIYSCGAFDYRCGGHLILWSLGLVIKFPPGCGILVPSASVTHANIPIASNEHRHSATFFTAAGLLRWYFNGFMTDKEFLVRAADEQKKDWMEYRLALWKVGLDMLRDN